ncbi:hypothetical protein [Roseomonas sp. HF4]|uniref:hypothetical protein n=1 Tax=Roseomonas sp. HF4 TaxID=2562313 RepID=UPI0010C068A2|nr:hypothetical protein [Roseomonas sp. HF4]
MNSPSFAQGTKLASDPIPALPLVGGIGAFLRVGPGARPAATPAPRDAVDCAAARLRALGPCGGTVEAERAARALAAAFCAKVLRGVVARVRVRHMTTRARHGD